MEGRYRYRNKKNRDDKSTSRSCQFATLKSGYTIDQNGWA